MSPKASASGLLLAGWNVCANANASHCACAVPASDAAMLARASAKIF
jgi:hypothetical protein